MAVMDFYLKELTLFHFAPDDDGESPVDLSRYSEDQVKQILDNTEKAIVDHKRITDFCNGVPGENGNKIIKFGRLFNRRSA